MRPNTIDVRHLQHEAQQARQHQHVDQNVGAEAEEGVPVARRPQCGRGFRKVASIALLIDDAPACNALASPR